jgi:poly-gamma-glutamate synthesis protein (capsule biosynthesis protein)
LDRAGLAHTGSYATRRDSRRPTLVTADSGGSEVTVGLVSATYGLNGLPVPSEAPWSVDLIDVAKIEARARAARRAGADIVMVALHWGTDGYAPVTDEQRRVAGLLTRSKDVDLVYGHHAHVVQPFEKVNGTWVLYGLGNAIAQQDSARPDLWEGVAARVVFREQPNGRFEVVRVGARPTLVTPYGARPMRYLDVGRALADPDWDDLRARLLAARRDVLARVALPR